jgi:hypothetical protein
MGAVTEWSQNPYRSRAAHVPPQTEIAVIALLAAAYSGADPARRLSWPTHRIRLYEPVLLRGSPPEAARPSCPPVSETATPARSNETGSAAIVATTKATCRSWYGCYAGFDRIPCWHCTIPVSHTGLNHAFLVSDRLRLQNGGYGSANTMSALPRGAPYISGAYPSTQPPHPVGTAMYCFPFTL